MSQIRALIFDFGGVLMRTMTDAPRREFERRMGLPPGRFDEVAYQSPLWDATQLGQVTYEQFWQDVGRRLGLDLSLEEAGKLGNTFWSGDRLDEELMAFIRRLRERGYRTAMLSNAPSYLCDFVEGLGIAADFDVLVVSGCEGVMKPDPAIYRLTLERLGVAPVEAVFIDDRPENIAAARQVGMPAVRFRGLAPLRRWLRELGIPAPPPARTPRDGIRAVVFDWGGVLEALPDDSQVQEWERQLSLEPGRLSAVLWGEDWERLSLGEIDEAEYAASIAARLGLPDALAGERLMAQVRAAGRLRPEVLAAVRRLRGRYRVALLTNASAEQPARLREQYGVDVAAEFDLYVNSAHVGLRKPDPAIYNLTAERLGIALAEAVLVDDLVRNVDRARFIGMHAIQFVEPEESLGELWACLGLAGEEV